MGVDVIKRFADRVGYSPDQVERFHDQGHRVRQVEHLSKAAPLYTIRVEIVASEHCNSGHCVGQRIHMDVDGNLIVKYCPPRMCVYLVSQLTVPVALINERLSEGLPPQDFHFMRHIRCLDVGVECLGYGQVMAKVSLVSRQEVQG